MRTTLSTADGGMELNASGDPATARDAIVVIQEAFGVTEHIERCVARLADEGFYAVAPALFHRTTNEAFSYDNYEGIRKHMEALSAEGITADLLATVAHLEGLGSTSTAGASSGSAWGARSRSWPGRSGSSARPSPSTEAASRRGGSGLRHSSSLHLGSRALGSAATETSTRESRSTTSRRSVRRRLAHRS